jgi:hypothetical protein
MDFNLSDGAATIIQLSLAPIFLIVGIGQLVNVATGRLARIVDRARYFDDMLSEDPNKLNKKCIRELVSLRRRMRFSNWAITLLTSSAVMVCIDVILLLLNGVLTVELNSAVIITFIISLTFLTAGLAAFLFEVSLATASLKINPKYFDR